MRLNFWVALIGTLGGLIWFARIQFYAKPAAAGDSDADANSLPRPSIRDLGRREPGPPRGGDAVAHDLEAARCGGRRS